MALIQQSIESMKTENSTEETEITEPETSFRRTLEETILRTFLLACALDKATPRNAALSSVEDNSLLEDLSDLETELQEIHVGAFIPAVLTIACGKSRQWELDLLETLSCKTDHWDSVLRLTFELEALNSSLTSLCDHERATRTLEEMKKRIQGHLNFQLQILGTWINTEEKHGRPAMKIVEKSKTEVVELWPEVVSAVIGDECLEKEPAAAQILQALPGVGGVIANALSRNQKHA